VVLKRELRGGELSVGGKRGNRRHFSFVGFC